MLTDEGCSQTPEIFLQQTVVNAETQNLAKVQKISVYEVLGCKEDIYIIIPSLGLRVHLGRGGQEECKSQR